MTQKQIILITAALLIFLAIAVFFWSITDSLYCFLIVLLALVMPRIDFIRYWLVKPEISTTTDHLPPAIEPEPLRLSISNVLAKHLFVDCYIKNDLSVLGTGMPEQLKEAFEDLLSQYYSIKKDNNVDRQIKTHKKILLYHAEIKHIETYCTILKERYSVAAAGVLRELYPSRPFTLETLEEDLNWVASDIQSKRIQIDMLSVEIAAKDGKKVSEPAETDFYTKRLYMVQGLKVDIDLEKYTVMEWAVAENAYHKHIEFLEQQNRNMKNGR